MSTGYQGALTGQQIDALPGRIAALEAETFPLTIVQTGNAGTYEVGTSVTPTMSLSITRKGTSVASTAVVSVSPSEGVTIAQDKSGWTGPAINSGNNSFTTTVQQGGQTKTATAAFNFTYYRYRGAIDSVPSDYAVAIKALTTKELSTTTTLGSTALAANKYYLFAVKGDNVTFVVRHAQTGAEISGCVTGTATIEQENQQGSNTYSYVLVPASSSSWNFTISNS